MFGREHPGGADLGVSARLQGRSVYVFCFCLGFTRLKVWGCLLAC